MSDIRDNFFLLYLEILGNEAKYLETTTMVIGSKDVEFGYPLKFFTIYYRQRDLKLDDLFFRNIRVKNEIFL